MTKQRAIENHTHLVNTRRKAVSEEATTEEESETKKTTLLGIDREVSILGQIHNPRISAKSLAALNLTNN